MGKTKDLIPLKELNLTNRFLFDEVLEDPDTSGYSQYYLWKGYSFAGTK